jgi:8-oxo-dGTP pyrophosphatase MutT (NUDIX family)
VADASGSQRHDAVARQLAGHVPGDAHERAALRDITAQLEALAAPFDEQAAPTHITGSAIVVSDAGTLLHLHRRAGRWLQPGGHVDGDEMPWDCAAREVLEETGIRARHPQGGARLLHVDVHPAAKGHTHLDLRYLMTATATRPNPPPGESQHVRWVPWDEALSIDEPPLRAALSAARRWCL